jgi:hypothetical protein
LKEAVERVVESIFLKRETKAAGDPYTMTASENTRTPEHISVRDERGRRMFISSGKI